MTFFVNQGPLLHDISENIGVAQGGQDTPEHDRDENLERFNNVDSDSSDSEEENAEFLNLDDLPEPNL